MSLIKSSNKKISDRLEALETGTIKRKRSLKITATGLGDASAVKKKRVASTKASAKIAQMTVDDNDDDEDDDIVDETDSEQG